jgi:N-acetylglucosaminyldiphosphoundecaprenol N-acetyl-beta-D-mannosaminyltransferase
MKTPNRVLLYGVPISCLSFGQTVALVEERVKRHMSATFFAVNVHILLEMRNNPEVLGAVDPTMDVIFADGVPLIWLSKLKRSPLSGRVSGTDLVEKLLYGKHRCFLIGSIPDVLQKMEAIYGSTKTGGSVCGTFAPPFGPAWDETVDRRIVQAIRRAKPDIIFVGVGPLKQERWIQRYRDSLGPAVWIPVGSAFDILSGRRPRAPRFIQRIGCEWVWRTIQEPRRLLPRYTRDATRLLRVIATDGQPTPRYG